MKRAAVFLLLVLGFCASLCAAVGGTLASFYIGSPMLCFPAQFVGFGAAVLFGRAMEAHAAYVSPEELAAFIASQATQ